MGPKPVASEDQTGFSPDDRNASELICNIIIIIMFVLDNRNSLYMMNTSYCHEITVVNYMYMCIQSIKNNRN